MKTLKLLIVLMLAFSSFGVIAQEKPEKKEKVKVEKPYIVHDRSSKVSRVDVRKDVKGVNNIVQIDATNASGGTGMVSKDATLAPAVITNVNVVNGNYNQTRELSKGSRGMSMQLLDVVFPFRIRVNVSAEQYVDVEIKEAGFWKVSIAIAN